MLERLEQKRADMQSELQNTFGKRRFSWRTSTDIQGIAEKDLLVLVRHEHFGHRLHVSRLADREKMARGHGFRLIGGGKNTKLVEYDVRHISLLKCWTDRTGIYEFGERI